MEIVRGSNDYRYLTRLHISLMNPTYELTNIFSKVQTVDAV